MFIGSKEKQPEKKYWRWLILTAFFALSVATLVLLLTSGQSDRYSFLGKAIRLQNEDSSFGSNANQDFLDQVKRNYRLDEHPAVTIDKAGKELTPLGFTMTQLNKHNASFYKGGETLDVGYNFRGRYTTVKHTILPTSNLITCIANWFGFQPH